MPKNSSNLDMFGDDEWQEPDVYELLSWDLPGMRIKKRTLKPKESRPSKLRSRKC